MNVFFDSSALAKRYLEESGSQKVERLCLRAERVLVSILCLPEIVSALNRKKREMIISQEHYNVIKERILLEFEDFLSYPVTPRVLSLSIECLEKYPLRAMDSLHLACALDIRPGLFVSADERQLEAARKMRLKVQRV